MKNNKILMSLVVASVYAVAGAPSVIAAEKEKNTDKEAAKDTEKDVQKVASAPVISLEKIADNTKLAKKPESEGVRAKMEEDLEALLNKRVALDAIYGSISIVADNYGKDKQTLKEEVYKDFSFSYGNDSTNNGNYSGTVLPPGQQAFCHIGCHTACHTACHGSRGWR